MNIGAIEKLRNLPIESLANKHTNSQQQTYVSKLMPELNQMHCEPICQLQKRNANDIWYASTSLLKSAFKAIWMNAWIHQSPNTLTVKRYERNTVAINDFYEHTFAKPSHHRNHHKNFNATLSTLNTNLYMNCRHQRKSRHLILFNTSHTSLKFTARARKII